MRFWLRLMILIFFLAGSIFWVGVRFTNIRAFGENSTDTKKNAETALKVLTQNCGQCHQSTLLTAKSKALAIFDLDKKDWHRSVADKHLESISQRISNKSNIPASDREATLEFITCVRKGNC